MEINYNIFLANVNVKIDFLKLNWYVTKFSEILHPILDFRGITLGTIRRQRTVLRFSWQSKT